MLATVVLCRDPGSTSTLRTVAHGGANIDVLVALGTGYGVCSECVHLHRPWPRLYEAAAVVITPGPAREEPGVNARAKRAKPYETRPSLKTASVVQPDGRESGSHR